MIFIGCLWIKHKNIKLVFSALTAGATICLAYFAHEGLSDWKKNLKKDLKFKEANIIDDLRAGLTKLCIIVIADSEKRDVIDVIKNFSPFSYSQLDPIFVASADAESGSIPSEIKKFIQQLPRKENPSRTRDENLVFWNAFGDVWNYYFLMLSQTTEIKKELKKNFCDFTNAATECWISQEFGDTGGREKCLNLEILKDPFKHLQCNLKTARKYIEGS